ncbi:MAG: SHOCT domain-containing protein [Burkholderiales bacterium]|jgi:putative membrane protein
MMDYGMGWGFGWFGMILVWVVPLILILVGIKYLLSDGRFGTGHTTSEHQPQPKSALKVLEERYARGEIDRDEFQQKRDDILEK